MADRSEVSGAVTSEAVNILTTKIDPTSARFEANMRFLADLMSQVRNEGEKICEGGGPKAVESQHAKGRLTARRPGFSCRCRKMFFPTRTTSAASSAITRSCPLSAFRRSRPSWECAWLVADIFP
jgi:hypothetical protein